MAFSWLSERSGEKTSCLRTFEKTTDTSLWRNTVRRLANQTISSPHYGFLWRENEEAMFWSFHPLADKTNDEHLPKPFSRSYKSRSNGPVQRFEFRTSLLDGIQAESLFLSPSFKKKTKGGSVNRVTFWHSGSFNSLHQSNRTVFFCSFVFSFSLKYACFDKTLQCFHRACFEVHVVLGEFFINAYNFSPLFLYVIYVGSKWEITFCC